MATSSGTAPMITNATSSHLSASRNVRHHGTAPENAPSAMRADRRIGPDVAAVVAVGAGHQVTPASANARTARADGQAHFSFTSSRAPASAGLPRQVRDRPGRGRWTRPGPSWAAMLNRCASCGRWSSSWPSARSAVASIRQSIDLPRGDQTAGDRVAHLARMDRPEITGKLVIGDQDDVGPPSVVRQVQPAGPVQDLGLHPGQHLEPGHRAAARPRRPRSPAPTPSRGARVRPGRAPAARAAARPPRSAPAVLTASSENVE